MPSPSSVQEPLPARPVVALLWEDADAAAYKKRMVPVLGDFDMRVYPNIGNPDDIDYAMVWMPPIGELARYPNLKAIFSIAAGVTHILRDPHWPKHVPIVRLTDDILNLDMACHATYWVLHFHRNFEAYAKQQREKHWSRLPYPPNSERRIGVLGMGTIGTVIARQLSDLGFDVAGWSRSEKRVNGVSSYFSDDQLSSFLQRTDILINVLPPTPATVGLLNTSTLAQLSAGAWVINMGRGDTLDDGALITALNNGHIAGAALDVFMEEPLTAEHPYWSHPKVHITPHSAGPSGIDYAARRIAENMLLMMKGHTPDAVMDPTKGY